MLKFECFCFFDWGKFTYPDPVCNTLLYSSHSLVRYHDCSIREYRSILAIITGHHVCIRPMAQWVTYIDNECLFNLFENYTYVLMLLV